MRCWRVVHLDATPTDHWSPGGALFVDPAWQGQGRFDISRYARTLYVAESAAAAVGESFASEAVWTDPMFVSGITGQRRALVTYELDTTGLVDLDDARFLAARNYRPSDVVARNRARSQEIALELWLEGIRSLRWWSYHRPEWRVVSTWAPLDDDQPWSDIVEVVESTELSIGHPAVLVAADVLKRIRHGTIE